MTYIDLDEVLDAIEEMMREARRQGYTAEEALARLHARILMMTMTKHQEQHGNKTTSTRPSSGL